MCVCVGMYTCVKNNFFVQIHRQKKISEVFRFRVGVGAYFLKKQSDSI